MTLFRLLAAIVLLCDIEFEPVDNNSTPHECVFIKNESVALKVAELLCVDSDDLTTVLLSSNVTTSSGSVLWPRSLENALESRDCLAKNLYARLFGWIVKQLNDQMNIEDSR